jgi:hypothetical protein
MVSRKKKYKNSETGLSQGALAVQVINAELYKHLKEQLNKWG